MSRITILILLIYLVSIKCFPQTDEFKECKAKTRAIISNSLELEQKGKSNEAFNILEASLSSSITEKCRGLILLQLGLLGNRHNRIMEGVKYLDEASKIFLRNKMYPEQIKANNIMGGFYFVLGDYDITIIYTKKAIQIAKENNLNQSLDLLYNNLAGAFGGLNRYDSALKHIESSIKIASENNNTSTLLHSLSTKAEILLKSDNYDEAEQYFYKVIQTGEDQNLLSDYLKSGCLYGLASCKFKTGNHSEALELATEGFKIADADGHIVIAEESAKLLYNIWNSINNTDSAYHYLRIYVANLEELQSKETLSQLNRFRMRKAENLLIAKDQQTQEQKYYTVIGIITAFLSLSILIVIYFSYRNSRKLNEELKVKNEAIGQANSKLEQQKIELDEFSKLKDKVFSAVIHDFKTPINSLEGMLNLLIKKYMTPQEAAENAKILLKKLSRAKFAINSTITWIKTQFDGYQPQMQPILLGTFMQEIENYHTSDLSNKKITLTTVVEGDPEFESDKDLLFIIINNLLSNAIKFSEQNSEIIIKTVCDENELQIQVIDNGIGMDQSELNQILHFSGKSSTGTSEERGSGLGLKVSNELISNLNGKIIAQSEKGVGTTFSIMIPSKLE